MFGLGGPEIIMIGSIYLIPLLCLITITIVLCRFLFIKARYYQRIGIIEKGGGLSASEQNQNEKQGALKIGMFLVAVSIGLLTANMLTKFLPIQSVVIYFSMIFLFGGASLILYYLLSSKYIIK